MIGKIKSKFHSEEYKRLLSNFISLSLLQGATYILPLITVPYLVRVLGVEYFGLLAFATATVAYFNIVTDYGFNLTATRELSIHRDDKGKVVEIFSSVMTIKFILMLICLVLLTILVFSFEKFAKDWEIYFFTFGTVIGHMLFPVWFFQGMERMKYITYLNILSKSIFTVAIFIFVHKQSDFYIVPILTSLGFILSGILSLIIIKKEFDILFKWQKLKTLIYYLKEAHHIFISNIAISLYTASSTFILGIFTNNTIVGYFAAADKIIQVFKTLMSPLAQTIYPHISRKVSVSKEEGLSFIKRIFVYAGIFTGLLSIFIFIFADFFVNLILGNQYDKSIILLQIMAVLPLLGWIINIAGVQTMLTFNRKNAFSMIFILGSILSLSLSIILVPLFQDIGSAIVMVITELFISITMVVYLQTHGLKLIGVNKHV